MPSFTVRVGVLLIVFGVASYVTSGGVSVTALIPSVVGALMAVCGLVALRSQSARVHAMRAAMVIALVGVYGTISALFQLPALLAGAEVPRRPAVIARSSMALILLVYLGMAAKALVGASLRRKA
jgi:hypothetical protein